MSGLTPRQIVRELDKFIIGQEAAKRAVAVALRNRFRQEQLDSTLRAEVVPKNILMIGPTGVGKTEIARRLARLVKAPFIKVEATKYTEVGYVGRDVESMVRDLVETSLRMVKAERIDAVKAQAELAVTERILDILAPMPQSRPHRRNPLEAIFSGSTAVPESEDPDIAGRNTEALAQRRQAAARLAAGELEAETVELEVEEAAGMPMFDVFQGPGLEEMGNSLQEMLGHLLPKRKRKRKTTVEQARRLLLQEEAQKLIDMDQAAAEAIKRAENDGIIFIDEFDKIAGKEGSYGPEVSREGVQRDILPIVEGSTVQTKYGPVTTDHILFIAAGAFHVSKPSDLIPELQGRFPIRVELDPLNAEDFIRIMTEPETALTRQYAALLATEGVTLKFLDDGIAAIAEAAARVNAETEDIGARRLYTIMEKLLEDVSFLAPELAPATIHVNRGYVDEKLSGVLRTGDISRFIL